MPDITPVYPTNDIANQTPTLDDATTQTANEGEDIDLEELEEELIIEDFTIDGICGVY